MAALIDPVAMLLSLYDDITDCNGGSMWFGFLLVRLVCLYVSELPWWNVYSHFQCEVKTSVFCRQTCYDSHLDAPIVSIWTITYVLFIISVLIMERLASQLRCSLTKANRNKEALVVSTGANTHTSFQRQKTVFMIYMAYILLRMHIEIAFLYVMVMGHLPTLEKTPIVCSSWLCPGPYDCALQTAVEKRLLVFLLCAISVVIISSCFILGLYAMCSSVVNDCSRHGNPI